MISMWARGPDKPMKSACRLDLRQENIASLFPIDDNNRGSGFVLILGEVAAVQQPRLQREKVVRAVVPVGDFLVLTVVRQASSAQPAGCNFTARVEAAGRRWEGASRLTSPWNRQPTHIHANTVLASARGVRCVS
jgi:hypothetical protein